MIDASLNEVETLAAKAARGAGLAWGLAEEAGRAARWLARSNLPWAEPLLAVAEAHLTGRLGGAGVTGSARSPIVAGTLLADGVLGAGAVAIEAVLAPVLLAPFVALVSRRTGLPIDLAWPGARLVVTQEGAVAHADGAIEIARPGPFDVCVRPLTIAAAPSHRAAHAVRASVTDGVWQALEGIGARTYVPASAQSRATGAGAGLTDND